MDAGRDAPARLAAGVHAALSAPFYATYTAARAALGPAWFVRVVGFFYASSGGGGFVPTWAWASWTVVIGAGITVSIVWVGNLWLEYFWERKESKLLKISKQQ